MTKIDIDLDPITNVAGRYQFETRRAEGVTEYPTEAAREAQDLDEDEFTPVPVGIEAKRNHLDHLVLECYAWQGCSVKQYFDGAFSLAKQFDQLVEDHDLEIVDEFSDSEELLEIYHGDKEGSA